MDAEVVVLVEGESDAAAVQTLADRYAIAPGRLSTIVAFGVTNYGRILTELAYPPTTARIVGLYDDPEEHVVRRAVVAAGLGTPSDRGDLERLGFHACVADLEAEFIRAIGTEGVEQLIEREGELPSLRRFQAQPAQRGRPADQQLRRFMGTKSMRKIRYGHLLAAAVELDAVPDPLHRVTVELLPPG
jgi:hypothetical protein